MKLSYSLSTDTHQKHRLALTKLTFNNEYIFSSSRDGSINANPLNNDNLFFALSAHSDWVGDMSIAKNNLISCSFDRSILYWNLSTKTSHLIGHHSDYVKRISYVPNKDWIVSGGFDKKVVVWDTLSAEIQIEFPEQQYSVYALAVSPTASVIASGSYEKVIRLWDHRNGNCVMKLSGHSDMVRDLLVSDDGRFLLSASSDKTIRIWSLEEHRCLESFSMHKDSVWCLFSDSPDFSNFYSGGKDGLLLKTFKKGNAYESVCVCKENSGISSLGVKNESIYSATNSVHLNVWRDVPLNEILDLPAEMSVWNSLQQEAIPSNAKFAGIARPFSVSGSLDMIDTRHSVQDLRISRAALLTPEVAFPKSRPVRPINLNPMQVIQGNPGIASCKLLDSKRFVLTLDVEGNVVLWDIVSSKEFGECDMEKIAEEENANRFQWAATWCEVDTKRGELNMTLDVQRCFDGEVYYDELGIHPNDSEDVRFNIGKWVLFNLFRGFLLSWAEDIDEIPSESDGEDKPERSHSRDFSLNASISSVQSSNQMNTTSASVASKLKSMQMTNREEGEELKISRKSLLDRIAKLDKELPPGKVPETIEITIFNDKTNELSFKGTVSSLSSRPRPSLPHWILDVLLCDTIRTKDPGKIRFLLLPSQGSELPELPSKSNRLNANRMLRVSKIYGYLASKLDLESVDEWCLECSGTVLNDMMTLAVIKMYIWKGEGSDVVITYRKGENVSR